MKIIPQIKKFVEEECKKPTSKYGYDPFLHHFVFMAKYAKELAKKLHADEEIVELAAWLHDIGSIIYGRDNHHMTSAKVANEKLKELKYPKNKIKQVCDCILSHRGSQKIRPKNLEAQIIIEADSMSAINNIAGLFQCAFSYEKRSRIDGEVSVKQKIENKWKQLRFKESKAMLKDKYEAAMLLLN